MVNLTADERTVLTAVQHGGESISGTTLFADLRLRSRELAGILESLKAQGLVDSYNPSPATMEGTYNKPLNVQSTDGSTRWTITDNGRLVLKK